MIFCKKNDSLDKEQVKIRKVNKITHNSGKNSSCIKKMQNCINDSSAERLIRISPVVMPLKKINSNKDSEIQSQSIFNELKASLQNKAHNIQYRKSNIHNKIEVTIESNNKEIIETNYDFLPSQRHQRSSTYGCLSDLIIISAKNLN